MRTFHFKHAYKCITYSTPISTWHMTSRPTEARWFFFLLLYLCSSSFLLLRWRLCFVAMYYHCSRSRKPPALFLVVATPCFSNGRAFRLEKVRKTLPLRCSQLESKSIFLFLSSTAQIRCVRGGDE
eukprot:RCo012548